MGESLMFSYLKHVKECKIVQTNWKVSSCWESSCSEELLENLRDQIDHEISEYVFGGEDVSKILKQAEIDAIGVACDGEGNQIAYAIDVAFHKSGLGYGNAQENINKVIGKCIRTVMCIYKYLDVRRAEIIFATPKIKMNEIEKLEGQFKKAIQIVRNHLEYD